jgi:hypothetical protein
MKVVQENTVRRKIERKFADKLIIEGNLAESRQITVKYC